MGNQRHSPLGRQRGGRVAKADSGKKWGARSGNADAGPGANVSRRAMRSCVAGRVRKQEGSGLPHPDHGQARQERLTRSIFASADASLRVASQFRRKAVSVELTHARQAELCEQGQLGRCGQ
jgi:hypothetical protein